MRGGTTARVSASDSSGSSSGADEGPTLEAMLEASHHMQSVLQATADCAGVGSGNGNGGSGGGGGASTSLTEDLPCPILPSYTSSSTSNSGGGNRRRKVNNGRDNTIGGFFDVTFQNTLEFEKYRRDRLASMSLDLVVQTYTSSDTLLFHYLGREGEGGGGGGDDDEEKCLHLDHHFLDISMDTCMAIVMVENTNHTYDTIRIDQDIDIYGLSISNPDPSQIDKYSTKFGLNRFNQNKIWPTGFFRKVPKERGRERTKEKLGTFLKHYEKMREQLIAKLSSHGIGKGDDVVVMVLNEGELDLFLNFACSCRLHDLSLDHVLVFAGNSELVTMVEATGAMGLYHEGYASVSKKASTDYLDRVFVDMMWYKAFSVYFVLAEGVNILFQDVDLVWFHDPMAYFHDYQAATNGQVTAFFSDDGQRSKRYTPFYANSGFYYLVANQDSVYFTWSIMIAMDAIQVLGSHQNVLTTRLIEGLALSFDKIKLLPLEEFPTGIMYHHDRKYMKLLRQHDPSIHPYNFHMCWTQGKPDKLIYLRKAAMWYLTEECSPLDALIGPDPNSRRMEDHKRPEGVVYSFVHSRKDLSVVEKWDALSHRCCSAMPDAP
eukprot:scaffold2721_cov181-Ochromonas_danica.AAC.9